MRTITLPQELIDDETADVQLYDYCVNQESTKQQVNLTMNTFSFLQDGQKGVISNNADVAISNQEFLLMKSGKCLMTEKLASPGTQYRSVLLFFSDQALSGFLRKHEISLGKPEEQPSMQRIQYDGYLRTFVKSLVETKLLSMDAQRRLLPIKFEELMSYLVDVYGTGLLSFMTSGTSSHVNHFLDVVENNKLTKLTLNELAFLSNMSLSTFKREFEKHFSTSPSKWFLDRRLEYAAFLLRSEARRPSDIFEEIGYDSLTNFIQGFKQKYGLTPKQYQIS